MPEPSVRADLAAGRLVRLQLPEVRGGAYPLHAIYRTDSPPGTAAAWMIQKFVDQDANECTKATHSPGNRSRPIRGGGKARIK
jgi:DNA-binding transcriptional LysR family regulator